MRRGREEAHCNRGSIHGDYLSRLTQTLSFRADWKEINDRCYTIRSEQ